MYSYRYPRYAFMLAEDDRYLKMILKKIQSVGLATCEGG